MRIFILIAGTNEPSNANALADAFIQGMQHLGGVEVHKRRLKDMRIEHFTLDCYAPACRQEEDFCALQTLMEESDGFVIASPVWNFGVPGHLKNFIDRMGSFALDATRSRGTLGGKPFYLIFTGGAPAVAWKALMRSTTSFVPEALKYFGATHIATHFEEKCTKGRGAFGLVVDGRPASLENVRAQGSRFAKVVDRFARTGQLPARKKFLRTLTNWGQSVVKRL
jgi:multimeric flavodoxin WrbA